MYGSFRWQAHLNTDQVLLFSLKKTKKTLWIKFTLKHDSTQMIFFSDGFINWCNSSGQLEIFIVILSIFITFMVLPEACKKYLPFWLCSVTQQVISQKKQLLSALSITFYLQQGWFHHNTRCFMPFQSYIVSNLNPLILIWNKVLSFKWQFFPFATWITWTF